MAVSGSRVAGVALVLTGVAVALAAAPPAGVPRAEVVVADLQLGERTRADGAKGRFAIRNLGDAELQIISAEPSCGCTVVSFDRFIPPGQTGYVEAEVDIATIRGSVWSQIHVQTNDPEHPELLLDLKARVVGGVVVLPAEDVFLYNRVGRLPSARVLLRKNDDEEGTLEVAAIRPSVEWLRASARPLEAAQEAGEGLPEGLPGDWVLEVAVAGEPAYGRQEQSIRFTTGLPREPEVVVPVVLDLRPPVNLSTEAVVLSPGAASQTVVLAVREGAQPSSLTVAAEPEGLQIFLEPMGGRYFKLHVRGSDALKGQAAAVVLHVGLEEMRLPVEWRAEGPPGS